MMVEDDFDRTFVTLAFTPILSILKTLTLNWILFALSDQLHEVLFVVAIENVLMV